MIHRQPSRFFSAFFLLLGALGLIPLAFAQESVWDEHPTAKDKPVPLTVYRSPTCQCCKQWVAHMERHGYTVKDVEEADMITLKMKLDVPPEMQSCHTAQVGGYLLEGHVPALDVDRLLKERPKLRGIAVPGMPMGSPGMEIGGHKDLFTVMGFGEGLHFKAFHEYTKY